MQDSDISTFNAVKEAGLAKLLPGSPRHRCGHGIAAQETAPRACCTHSPMASIAAAWTFISPASATQLLRPGTARQYLDSRQAESGAAHRFSPTT